MRQINILIADDDRQICELFSEIIRNAGHQVYSALDSGLCKTILSTTQIDVLFLDLCYPTISEGYDTLDFVHENYPGVEIIMLSGAGSIQDVVRSLKYGASDFIEKPLTLERLLSKIRVFERRLSLEESNTDLSIKAMQMIGSSQVMQTVYSQIILAAQYNSPVLITGETGVGKELVAKAIHKLSKFSGKNLITVNCGAIPHDLVESELFGFEQGAFTGANKTRKGYFEYAEGGTILLDEISELPLLAQAKLLRVLSEGEMQKLGGKIQKVNCRVICSTNRDIRAMVQSGGFREDLFHRINTIHIEVPPLRARKEDIPELATNFLNHFCTKNNALPKAISPHAMHWLEENEWTGNVRELRNVIERGVIFAANDHLTVSDIQPTKSLPAVPECSITGSLRSVILSFEKHYIISALYNNNWNITNTARVLELDKSNLIKKIKQHQIVKPS